MKRAWIKILMYALSGIALLIALGLIYIKTALPNVGPALTLKVEGNPTQIQRGAYLANGIMVCMQCHSQRDYALFAAPSILGTAGLGGEVHE